MEVIRSRDSLAQAILSPQMMAEGGTLSGCRLCRYVQKVPVDGGELWYHLVTGEMVFTSDKEADVQELFAKYYLVPKDHDDSLLFQQFHRVYMLMEASASRAKNVFSVLTTTGCNARCFYCYEQGVKRVSMSAETAADVVDYICNQADSSKPVELNWFGGEPLVNASAIDVIVDGLAKRGLTFSSTMITNGYLFDEDMVAKAAGSWRLRRVQISLDGTEDVYNARKAYVGAGEGSPFRRVLGNVCSLAQADIEVRIRLNLDEGNHADLLDLVALLGKEFPPGNKVSVYCHELFSCGDGGSNVDSELYRLKDEVDEAICRVGFAEKRKVSLGVKTHYCMADASGSVIIMPDGFLQACEHFTMFEPFGAIWGEGDKQTVLPFFRERLIEQRCLECPARPACLKIAHCPVVRKGCSKDVVEAKLEGIRAAMISYYRKSQSFRIRVAGYLFEVRPLHAGLARYCEGFLVDEEPDCVFEMETADIAFEREAARKLAEDEGRPDPGFSDEYLESIALSRKIGEYAVKHGGAFMHGALIERGGKGYLFTAPSGTGKTTHVRNWLAAFDDVSVVNGDKPIFRVEPDGVYGWGTPWRGKENLGGSTCVRLDSVVILERGSENHIERVRYADCMAELITQLYVPAGPDGLRTVFSFVRELSQGVKLYRMRCTMDTESALVAFEGIEES